MKIEIEIPDWAGEQCLRIISGIEMVAYKHVSENWKIKSTRCSRCGACCTVVKCEYVTLSDGIAVCGRGVSMPFHCLVGVTCDLQEFKDVCRVTYKEKT